MAKKKTKQKAKPAKRRAMTETPLAMRAKATPKATPRDYLLCPEGLPKLSFHGARIGAASWNPRWRRTPGEKGDSRHRLELFGLPDDRRPGVSISYYLVRLVFAGSPPRFFASDSAVDLLIQLGGCSAAREAVLRLLDPRLQINNRADIASLVKLTKRGD